MGAYIQVGICTEIVVDKGELAQASLSREELIAWLGADFIDLSVFDLREDGDALRWTLPAGTLETGLIPFLRAQFALFYEESETPDAILSAIEEAGTAESILALAKAQSVMGLYRTILRGPYSLGSGRRRPLWLQATVLVYLVEGKALMEQSDRLFRYLETLIRRQRDTFPLAAAVKVFLQ